MSRSGVITITTDFGHKGPFTAIMKGVILNRFPDARIVDLIHDIPAQWPPEAGFWVSASYAWFPAGSVHLAIVDPGVGTERKVLLVESDGHYFIAPDNGLLARLLDRDASAQCFHLGDGAAEKIGLGEASKTFHGRDVFAPIAAEVAAGRVDFRDIGVTTDDWIPGWTDDAEVTADHASGIIITVDTFGNLISNIEAAQLDGFTEPVVHFAGLVLPLTETYGRASPGDYLALVNSFGMLEIARAEGDAAAGLGVGRSAPVIVRNGLPI